MKKRACFRQEEIDKYGLITRKQVQELMPLSGMTLWRMERHGIFPKHILIGRKAFWRRADILEFLCNVAKSG